MLARFFVTFCLALASCVGWTIPKERTIFTASSTFIFKSMVSFLGKKIMNPDVGFGVVGTNTARMLCCFVCFEISLVFSDVRNPIVQQPLRGYCTSTAF